MCGRLDLSSSFVHSVHMSHSAALEKLDDPEKAVEALLAGFNLWGGERLRLLRRVADRVQVVPSAEDAFERVRLRSIGTENQILEEEGGLVPDVKLAKLLGVSSRQTIHNYRVTGRVLAVPRGGRNFGYPAWQVHRGALLPGLPDTLKMLRKNKTSPLGCVLFFLTPAEALDDKRPLDLLRQGKTDEVHLHAERYGHIGS